MKCYVMGLLMTYDLDRFLLIDKGGIRNGNNILRVQGPGGEIRYNLHPNDPESETPHQAMEREFYEEIGYRIKLERWHCFHVKEFNDPTKKIYMLAAFASPDELHRIIQNCITKNILAQIFNYIDVLFTPENFTYDILYLIQIIMREQKSGHFYALDPEGWNRAAKNR